MRLFFAVLSVLLGLSLIFEGYRLGRFLIPLMGFLSGLSIGGAIIADVNNSGFLNTLWGVLVGTALGLLFAVFAYFYYTLAVVVLAGGLGYWMGSGFVLLFGFSPGTLSALVGIAIGILVAIGALMYNAPKYVLIVLTSVAGAVATVGGLMLLFNKIPLDAYSYTTAHIAISNSFWWSAAAVSAVVVGIITQIETTPEYEFEKWMIGTEEPAHSSSPKAAHHAA
jgi:hypothetical protein